MSQLGPQIGPAGPMAETLEADRRLALRNHNYGGNRLMSRVFSAVC